MKNKQAHNPSAWQDFDAWQCGYDDAIYEGIDAPGEMPCQCEACLKSYREGQEAAMADLKAAAEKTK